jgi:hypothetical protein
MKKIFYVIIVACLPILASAQKLVKPDVDKLTGDTTYKTSFEDISDNNTVRGTDELSCSAMVKNNKYALFFYIYSGNTKSSLFSIHKGSSLTVKLVNDSTITLWSLTDRTSTPLKVSPHRNACSGLYILSTDEISALKNNPITDIKIKTSNGVLDYELKDKKSLSISKQITLLTNR